MNWVVPSDVLEDCRQEAALFLWRRRGHLAALPQERRDAYLHVCITRLVWGCLQRELRQKARARALETLLTEDGLCVELPEEAAGDWRERVSDCLFDQLGRPDLAAAWPLLSPQDQEVLDLSFRLQLSDPEIGARLQLPAGTAKSRRQRALRRLAALVGAGGRAGPEEPAAP